MAGGAGDGDGDFVAGANLPGWFEDDGFELRGFAEPSAIAIAVSRFF
jgi:hypothetical protein